MANTPKHLKLHTCTACAEEFLSDDMFRTVSVYFYCRRCITKLFEDATKYPQEHMASRLPNQSSDPTGLHRYLQPELRKWTTEGEKENNEDKFCGACGLKWNACNCSTFFASKIRHYLNEYPQESTFKRLPNQSSQPIDLCRYFHPRL